MSFRGYTLDEKDKELLGKLRPHHRAVLTADGTYKQIASALGVPLGTVRSRMNRARTALERLKNVEQLKSDPEYDDDNIVCRSLSNLILRGRVTYKPGAGGGPGTLKYELEKLARYPQK